MLPAPVNRFCALKLTICALFLTGCATKTPTVPADSLQLPPPPSLSTPLPSEPYSKTAAQRMQSWSQKLMATQVMREPSAKPGQ